MNSLQRKFSDMYHVSSESLNRIKSVDPIINVYCDQTIITRYFLDTFK